MLKIDLKIKKSIIIIAMLIMTSCQNVVLNIERESFIDESLIMETLNTEEITDDQDILQGTIISSVYEDYYMNWDSICILIITYTTHFEGEPQFGLIGYNGMENPVLLVGNTTSDGFGEYDVYCFKNNRVYKSDETIKGKVYYNKKTKEFAVLKEREMFDIYTYHSNHIVWIKREIQIIEGFEPMILHSIHCVPSPTVDNIREFIV